MKKVLMSLTVLLIASCTEERIEASKVLPSIDQPTLKADNGYIGTFKFGSVWTDWYYRYLYNEYLGEGRRRRWCTAPPDYTCIVAVSTSDSPVSPSLNPDPSFVSQLQALIQEQDEQEIVEFFSRGEGRLHFAFLDSINPSYLVGLQSGEKTMIFGNDSNVSPENLYFIVDSGLTGSTFNIIEDDFFAIQF